MGFLSFGSAKGLAVRHDFQRDIDRLYQREAYRQGIEAQKAQKAQYYAQFMKEGTAVAPSNVRRLDSYYDDLNNQVADFMIEHGPAVETDINLQRQFMNLTDGYLNNDIIREDQQVQQEFEKMKQAKLSPSQFMRENERYHDYIENGGEPYVFNNIDSKSYSEIVETANKALLPETITTYDAKKVTQQEAVPEYKYAEMAVRNLSDPDISHVIQQQYEEAEARIPGYYKNATDMHIRDMKAGEAVKDQFRAWDPNYTASVRQKYQKQEETARKYPWWTQKLAPDFKVGNTIKGDDNLKVFTGFHNENRVWNLGAAGQTVSVMNKETGALEEVTLKGALKADNFGEMKVEADGGMIRVDVSARVSPSDISKSVKKEYYIDDEIVDKDTFDIRYNKLNRNKREGIDDGEEIKGLKIEEINVLQNEDLYKQAGFEPSGVYRPGEFDIGLDKKTGTFPVYSGSIWVPADINVNSLTSYEAAFGTTHLSGIQQQLTSKNIIQQAAAEGNIEFASEVLRDTYGGNWQQHPDDPNFFVRDMGGGNFRGYNIQTEEIGDL